MTSFKSYVAQATSEHAREREFTKAYEKASNNLNIDDDKLLPGEVAVGQTKNVIKYSIHDGPSKGNKGILICTNYRVMFYSNGNPTYDLIQTKNLLHGEDDILLNSIDSIFVEYPNKRKRLFPSSKVRDNIQKLEIHCKDFRVAAFNFKLALKGEEKSVIKAILHHSHPTLVSLMFAFFYKHTMVPSKVCNVPLYRCRNNWRKYLSKFDRWDDNWRITSLNEHFTISDSMNSLFVVPSSLNDNELKEASTAFVNNRLPSFCWLSKDGCSLIRESELRPNMDITEWERKFHNKIRQADPLHRHFKIVECGKSPNISQIQQSFLKLKQICKSGSEQDYLEVDGHWMSSLHSSKWLHHISSVLRTATDAAQMLTKQKVHVIVRESSGYDLTPAVTSLIQILLDPTCRTRHGFESLIQREWVVGGHPFLDRLGHIVQPLKTKPYNAVISSEGDIPVTVSPVFLLFLDCVWQLTVQYPSTFEFTSLYLITLHDSTYNTLFDTFIFNNERQRARKSEIPENEALAKVLPVWAWSVQYSDLTIFNNPLYRMKTSGLYEEYPPDTMEDEEEVNNLPKSLSTSCYSLDNAAENSSFPSSRSFAASSSSKHGRTSSDAGIIEASNIRDGDLVPDAVDGERKRRWFSLRRRKKKNEEDGDDEDVANSPRFYRTMISDLIKRNSAVTNFPDDEVLTPRWCVSGLKFWDGCYLRWNHWSQLLGGQPFSQYHQLSTLYDQINSLNNKVNKLSSQLAGHEKDGIPDSSDIEHNTSTIYPPEHAGRLVVMTSYYPYSPMVDIAKDSMTLGGRGRRLLRGGFVFSVGSPRSTNSQPKHVRTASNISATSPPVSNNDEQSADDVVSSSNDLDDVTDEGTAPISRGRRPKKALMPPKEKITYVSAV